jgi:hypothetical protein
LKCTAMPSVESYKHKFAKETVARWLRSQCKRDEYADLPPVSWRVNRGAPHFGVWIEYPVCLNHRNEIVGLCPVWDEAGPWEDHPPSYEDVLALSLTPILIFDLAIQHKGWIYAAIEIVHTNGISEKKLEYLKRVRAENGHLDVFVVDADWVLSRIERPHSLKYTVV